MSARTALRIAGLTAASASVGTVTALASISLLGRTTLEVAELIAVAGAAASTFSSLILLSPVVRRGHLLDEAVKTLEVVANTDQLTGLPNRRALFERAEALAERGVIYAVLMIDIDHFKQLNDASGHAAGDYALQKVADCIHTAVLREPSTPCLVGRIGGEEFAVVVVENRPGAAVSLAERLCRQVRNCSFDVDGSQTSLTVSIGVATGVSGAFDAGLSKADRAVYRSKRAGRDRWILEPRAVDDPTIAAA